MNAAAVLETLGREMRHELTGRILPFWSRRAVDEHGGGFIGYMGPDGVPDPDAPRGGILNARILWSFSAAHRALGDPEVRAVADRAADDLGRRFLDPEHGGLYWMVESSGTPVDDRKHVYAQAFAVYAFAEHHRATGAVQSLDRARALFALIEEHAFDGEHGGYREAFRRDWTPLTDVRLSERDLDAAKSENTHLHLLEAYTTLYRAWPDPVVADRLRALVELFRASIIAWDVGHTRPFFDRDWTVRSTIVSFGHDIETSWLLAEAAAALGDPGLEERVAKASLRLADTVLAEGLDPRGGVFYEVDETGRVDRAKEWWTQAESVVGFLHAYQGTGRPAFLAAARDTWAFIRSHHLDPRHGEWHRRTDRDGTPERQHEIVGPWKGPYHATRACLEVMERTGQLLSAGWPGRRNEAIP
jgi:mannobiose 2-epimerase